MRRRRIGRHNGCSVTLLKKCRAKKPGRQSNTDKINCCVEQKKGDNKTSVNHTDTVSNTIPIILQNNIFVKGFLQKNLPEHTFLFVLYDHEYQNL